MLAMASGELLALLPLFFATLVPVCFFVAAFLVPRQRSPLTCRSKVTLEAHWYS